MIKKDNELNVVAKEHNQLYSKMNKIICNLCKDRKKTKELQ